MRVGSEPEEAVDVEDELDVVLVESVSVDSSVDAESDDGEVGGGPGGGPPAPRGPPPWCARSDEEPSWPFDGAPVPLNCDRIASRLDATWLRPVESNVEEAEVEEEDVDEDELDVESLVESRLDDIFCMSWIRELEELDIDKDMNPPGAMARGQDGGPEDASGHIPAKDQFRPFRGIFSHLTRSRLRSR